MHIFQINVETIFDPVIPEVGHDIGMLQLLVQVNLDLAVRACRPKFNTKGIKQVLGENTTLSHVSPVSLGFHPRDIYSQPCGFAVFARLLQGKIQRAPVRTRACDL